MKIIALGKIAKDECAYIDACVQFSNILSFFTGAG
jgi:hypothetical protein